MTMVAACSFSDGAVIISDSRATWKPRGKPLSDDRLQKVVSIGPKVSLSFAGSGYLATKVIQNLREKLKLNKRYQHIGKISIEMPRIAKHYYHIYPEHATYGLALILAGVESSGRVIVYCYRSPDFNQEKVSSDFVIIGSGEVARPYLEENFAKINVSQNNLKQKADILSQGLDSALGRYKAEYVGGLFQVILISPAGIAPLQYHSIDIDPIGPPNYLGMRMERGRWIQEAGGKQFVLMEPHELMKASPQEMRIHEYFPRTIQPELRFYLSYFVTCLKVQRTQGDIVWCGTLSQIGSHKYPRAVPILASLGLWGPLVKRELQFRVDNGRETKVIQSRRVGDWYYYPERFEVDEMLNIEVEAPGPIFLDCVVDGNLLARKSLFFSDLRNEEPAKSKEEMTAKYKALSKRMPDEHRKCSDPLMEKRGVFLDYFMLCQKVSCEDENTTLKVHGEFRVVYSKSYPLNLRLCIASSFRMQPGSHFMEVRMKHAVTGDEHQIAKCEIDNDSSCTSIPVYADDLIVQIPKEGIYYVTSYIDGEFVGCVLLFAETDKPQFSYNLYKEDLARVSRGELLILLARSQQRSDSNIPAS